MRIGSISGYNAISAYQPNYKISSINGNPKQLDAIDKIGQQQYTSNPLAIVSKQDDEDTEKIREQQSRPFDIDGAMKRMQQGLNTFAAASTDSFNMDDAMGKMMQGSIFSAESIPMASIT